MIAVKICGITNLKDAQVVVRNGASALGFIFYNKSPRYILPETAGFIAEKLMGQVPLVGVFVDESLDHIHAVADQVGLNFIQLHGNESPEYCQQIQLPIIKVFKVASDFNTGIINNYDVHAFLFDTYAKDHIGGTGEIFNWNIIDNLKTDIPIVLSGGLNINNIKNGIEALSPSTVDVNSGVESSPGVKDEKKIIALFDILKNIDSSINPFEIPIIQGRSA